MLFPIVLSKFPLIKKLPLPSPIRSFHHHLPHRHYHLNVTVTSTETIKPSSPTPPHLSTFNLSLLDHHAPPRYVPFIFFYSPPATAGSKPGGRDEDKFQTLKASLSRTLTRFYPLAGRLSNTSSGSVPSVKCNDEGVPFSSAEIPSSSSMAQFLGRRPLEIDSLHQFLPFPASLVTSGMESAPQIAFRATAFPCSGIAVGVCSFHKIIDGATLADFMKLWSAVARGEEEKTAGGGVGGGYAHDRAARLLMPLGEEDIAVSADVDVFDREGEIVTRRFVFDEEAVSALKAAGKSDRVLDPSRTEAVAAFLWKSVVSAAAEALVLDGGKVGSVVSTTAFMVNLRPRMVEPWPNYSVGNIIWPTFSSFHYDHQHDSFSDETKTVLQRLVNELRGSVAKLDKEFMKSVTPRTF